MLGRFKGEAETGGVRGRPMVDVTSAECEGQDGVWPWTSARTLAFIRGDEESLEESRARSDMICLIPGEEHTGFVKGTLQSRGGGGKATRKGQQGSCRNHRDKSGLEAGGSW